MNEGLLSVQLLTLALAAWRLSSLFASEYGPFDLLEKFRVALGLRYEEHNRGVGVVVEPTVLSWDGYALERSLSLSDHPLSTPLGTWLLLRRELLLMLRCVWCSSVWFGFGLIFLYCFWPDATWALCLPLAMSATAILFEKAAR